MPGNVFVDASNLSAPRTNRRSKPSIFLNPEPCFLAPEQYSGQPLPSFAFPLRWRGTLGCTDAGCRCKPGSSQNVSTSTVILVFIASHATGCSIIGMGSFSASSK